MVHIHEQPTGAEARSVKSAFRALEILELLAREQRELSFSELRQALAYPKASLHSLLRTMIAARWISVDAASKTYGFGVRVWEAGIAYNKMLPLEDLARPIMERMRDVTSETVQLAVLDGFEVLYVAKIDGSHRLRLASTVGMRLLPHATGSGKVLLSGFTDKELIDWLEKFPLESYTPNTITDSQKFLQELSKVRKCGYAFDREERTVGVTCVAIGIRNHAGELAAAMSVSAPAVRFKKKEQLAALERLQTAAHELSTALGYTPAKGPAGDKDTAANRSRSR